MIDILKYCPTCSRSTNDARFIGEFCEFCVIDKISAGIPGNAQIDRCRSCERIRTPEGFDDFSFEALAESLKHELHLGECEVKVTSFDTHTMQAIARITCDYENDRVTFEKPVHIRFRRMMCQRCYRQSSGYYEALVQLRGAERAVEAISESITKFVESKGSFLSKTEKVQGGYDVYIGDKEVANQYFMLHRKLKLTRSYKLFGVKKGKKLFRNIYALHL